MSAGSFTTTKYESDEGTIHQITVQPEMVSATVGGDANGAPDGAVDSLFAAEVNRGARAYGLRPRKLRVTFEDSPPTGYRPYTTLLIPILTPELFGEIASGDAVSYNGGTGTAGRKVEENIRPGKAALGGGTEETTPEP